MNERGMTILSKMGLLCGQSTSNLEFYEHCVFGKQKRLSFLTTIHLTKGNIVLHQFGSLRTLSSVSKVMILVTYSLSLMNFQGRFGFIF
jgi:hypothetical protein